MGVASRIAGINTGKSVQPYGPLSLGDGRLRQSAPRAHPLLQPRLLLALKPLLVMAGATQRRSQPITAGSRGPCPLLLEVLLSTTAQREGRRGGGDLGAILNQELGDRKWHRPSVLALLAGG